MATTLCGSPVCSDRFQRSNNAAISTSDVALQLSVRTLFTSVCVAWFEAQPTSAAVTQYKPNDLIFIRRSYKRENVEANRSTYGACGVAKPQR
ncbi:hypothetical protein PROAA_1540010 [Candidatus Propionivibrio aalborgensis]|uniref:Uncharacterized protein n=1 Tax=Candidatus Propionivibrio aalborgensis TaxID=1860101 RepID=A0A1A8XL83_9RHOO|nr:hypothetical protein PROAA_1540010 [Candidatus Propionivibrio aalborgensis]